MPKQIFGVLASAVKNRRGMLRAALHKGAVEGLHPRFALFEGFRLQLLHRGADCDCRRVRRHRLAETHRNPVGNWRGTFHRKRPRSKLKMLPHTPSRFTGTIGTSTPFMIRSSPRRNGSSCPVRVICPSAKMHTISPSRSASLATCKDCRSSRGCCSLEIGMARTIFAKGFTTGWS